MSDTSKTRISLILRLKQPADAEAWEEFCEIYQPLILRIARSRGLQPADANDLTQDVLVRVAKSVEKWNPDPKFGSFRGWIGKIARNLVIDYLRREDLMPITGADSDIQQLINEAPDRCAETEFYDAEFEKQLFAWAAEKIKPSFQNSTWQAFWLTAVEHQRATDVANQLNISLGALYVARSRVIARLRKTIEAATGETELPVHRSEPERHRS